MHEASAQKVSKLLWNNCLRKTTEKGEEEGLRNRDLQALHHILLQASNSETGRKLNKRPTKNCCSNPTAFEGNAITFISIYKSFSSPTWNGTLNSTKKLLHISTKLLNKTVFPSKWPTKMPQFVISTRSPWKAFQKVAQRRCTKKLVPKNKSNLQY